MNQPTMMSAHTAQPNTPETDLMSKVPHIVSYVLDGQTHEMWVVAPCPLSAIEEARRILSVRQ